MNREEALFRAVLDLFAYHDAMKLRDEIANASWIALV